MDIKITDEQMRKWKMDREWMDDRIRRDRTRYNTKV